MKQLTVLIAVVFLYTISVIAGVEKAQPNKLCERRFMRRLQGRCFYFSVQKLNWFGALNDCLRKGLVLADLSSPLEFQSVTSFLYSKGNIDDFWFGGNDLQTEGRFQYVSSGRLVRYFSNLSLLDPASSSDCDDCLEVRIRNDMIVVSDDNCEERQYYICSERYCDNAIVAMKKKKRHHSHEHLHHFHHDIGSGDESSYIDGDFGGGGGGGGGGGVGGNGNAGGVGGGYVGNGGGYEYEVIEPEMIPPAEAEIDIELPKLDSTTTEMGIYDREITIYTTSTPQNELSTLLQTEYVTTTASILPTSTPISQDIGDVGGDYITQTPGTYTKPPYVRRRRVRKGSFTTRT